MSIIGGCLLFQTSLLAETITGQVVSVNSDDQTVTLEKASAAPQDMGQEITVHVKDATQMAGIEDLGQLDVGEEITVDANRRFFFGRWEANNITRQESAASALTAGETVQPIETDAADPVLDMEDKKTSDRTLGRDILPGTSLPETVQVEPMEGASKPVKAESATAASVTETSSGGKRLSGKDLMEQKNATTPTAVNPTDSAPNQKEPAQVKTAVQGPLA